MIRILVVTLLAVFLSGQIEAQKVKHVVLIGIDGLGANYISKEKMPALASLMATGAYSLHGTFRIAFIKCRQLGVDVHGS